MNHSFVIKLICKNVTSFIPLDNFVIQREVRIKKLTMEALLKAVKNGNMKEAKEEIALMTSVYNTLIDIPVREGETVTTAYTVLQNAVLNRHITVVKLLLDGGCYSNPILSYQKLDSTPLYIATSKKFFEISEMLLSKGASVIERHYQTGLTPLHLAAEKRDYRLLLLMLKYCQNINVTDNKDRTLFEVFIKKAQDSSIDYDPVRFIEVFEKLISKGADLCWKNKSKQTVLHLSIILEDKSLFCKLISMSKLKQLITEVDIEGNTILHSLLKSTLGNSLSSNEENNVDIFFKLVEKRIPIDISNNKQETLAHLAAKNKHFKILNIILNRSNDVNAWDQTENTVLHYLLNYADTLSDSLTEVWKKLVMIILSKQGKIDIKNKEGNSPLHIAAKSKNLDILFTMIKDGVGNISVADGAGNNILHLFLLKESVDHHIIKRLLAQGLKINAANTNGNTALHLAAEKNSYKLIVILSEFKPLVTLRNSSGDTPLHTLLKARSIDMDCVEWFLSMGASVDTPNHHMETPLQLAIYGIHSHNSIDTQKYIKACLEFLKRSENVDTHKSKDGYTAFQYLFIGDTIEENVLLPVVVSMIDKGAKESLSNSSLFNMVCKKKYLKIMLLLLKNDIAVKSSERNGNVLHYLSEFDNGDFETMKLIIEICMQRGCDINLKNKFGLTPFHLACEKGCLNAAKALMVNKANIHCTTEEKVTPLHSVVTSMNIEIANLLFKYGADPNARQYDDRTPLHLAVYHKDSTLIKLLFDNFAEINHVDRYGKTALHWACSFDNIEVAMSLISFGADITIRDASGKTPYDIAIQFTTSPLHKLIANCKLALLCSKHSQINVNPDIQQDLEACKREKDNLKRKMIDRHTSVFDLCHADENKLCIYSNNLTLKEILQKSDLMKRDFPMFRALIYSKFFKGKQRRQLLEMAAASLQCMVKKNIPDLCSDKIFVTLSNKDLLNVVRANSMIISKKRKIRQDDGKSKKRCI
uniref:Uncharacterized protein n=1 Tax=Trichogramma kaykai TaxID=54128 RepID=A0ABD2XFG1_9HYME